MNRRKLSIPLVIVVCILIGGVWFFGRSIGIERIEPYRGMVDCSNIAPDVVIGLSGEWDFYPGILATPSQITEGTYSDIRTTLPVPGSWFKPAFFEEYEGIRLGPIGNSTGVGTYALVVKTEGMHGLNAVSLPPIRSAYRMWIDGDLFAETGSPRASVSTERLDISPRFVVFRQDTDRINIVLQVSNFHAFAGGPWAGEPVYGKYRPMWVRDSLRSASRIMLMVLLFGIGIAHLGQYLSNKAVRYNVAFAVFCFLFALRVPVSQGSMLSRYLSDIPGIVWQRIEYMFFMVQPPAFLMYLSTIYPGELKPRWVALISALFGAGAVYVWVSPGDLVPYTLPVFGLLLLLTGAYVIISLVRSRQLGRRYVGFMIGSAAVLMAGGLNDVILQTGILQTYFVTNLVVFFYCLTQAMFLTKKNRESSDELRSLYDRLQRVQRQKEEFLTSTSHELRTPLHGIIGLAESLRESSRLNADQRSTVSLIISSGIRLSSLVNDVLDFSRLRTGQLQLHPKSVNIYQIVELVRSACEPLVAGRPISIKNQIRTRTHTVHGDETRIEQMLFNLLGFAIRMTDEGQISIHSEQDGDHVSIDVHIPPGHTLDEETKSSFNMDIDESNPLDGFESTNIGLLVCRILADAHGGEVRLLEAEDSTVLSLQLPLWTGEVSAADESDAVLQLDAVENLQPLFEESRSDQRLFEVMVVDDDIVALQIMKNHLVALRYSVIPLVDGESALSRIEKKKPDLVVLDVMLPRMSGFEVCSKIREKYSTTDLPVILVTAKNQTADIMEGLTSGASDYLTKPIIPEEFITRVNIHLQLAKINTVYSRFVPTEFLESLGIDNIAELKLGDQVQKEMTILFVDIRAFTQLSERMTPQENFKFINSYLSRISPFIQKNNGFVDKYIGDAIMALFPQSPEDAVNTALEMLGHIEVYNGHRSKCSYPPIRIGIGIHTGNLIMGIIGDGTRMQGTVISDAVNLASRVQDVTKFYGANIVISQDTFVKLENPTSYNFRFLGKVKVKGKMQIVSLFEIFDGDPEPLKTAKAQTKTDFEEAILIFSKREFAQARDLFRSVVNESPDDQAAAIFLDRCEKNILAEKRKFLTSM
jgi:two-component system, sensor histidine kinase ChiS